MATFTGKANARFGFYVVNPNSAFNKLLSYSKKVIEPALFIGFKKALYVIEREAVRLINQGYYKPAVDTGHMRRSVTSKILYSTHREIAGAVGVIDTSYTIYVHEGTYKMEKRPFLTDAVENKKEEIIDLFRGIIKTAIKVKK